MDETLIKINNLLKVFNETFELSASVEKENNQEIANSLKINNIKSTGSEFIKELSEMFNTIVTSVSDDHELVFNNEKGLVIAKKIVQVNYIIEE